jgi:D-apionolactonase
MLGLTSLPAMVATWRARHPALPLRVGPNAIAARSSPLGAQPPSDGTRRLALASTDPRTRAQFGAAWALGHVVGLAQPGVQAITLLSLCGANGVLALEGESCRRYPAFDVMAALGQPAQRWPVQVSQPQRVAALVLLRSGSPLLLLGNLTAEPVDLEVHGLPGIEGHHRLEPYGVTRLQPRAC